ncbi:hypothetical protein FK268_09415 [Tsukamurella sputi]|uniref:Uncharacterized protein n=1 Tax=Tsukamurella sputi TaxID=2591848 RepID=A0A5C5RQX4_9ACTN|nr:hypothetical protein [Tsukamurella sputi]TWS25397.1 hypothetical protein FK268_09415 [Tsukamurella sputi]
MAKIAAILRAREGWDTPASLPADRDAVANFTAWFSTVRADRQSDAEPMLTDEGNIRLEWDLGQHECTAEIGADTMWLCLLAPDPIDDADREVAFDAITLTRFFYSGILPSAK